MDLDEEEGGAEAVVGVFRGDVFEVGAEVVVGVLGADVFDGGGKVVVGVLKGDVFADVGIELLAEVEMKTVALVTPKQIDAPCSDQVPASQLRQGCH